MNKIKHILNLLFDPNYITPKQKEERIKYLNQFKKRRDDMTTAEKIMLTSLYCVEHKHSDTLRHLGALDATLIMVGVLEPGKSIPNDKIYKSYMLELTKEYLTKSGSYEENKTK